MSSSESALQSLSESARLWVAAGFQDRAALAERLLDRAIDLASESDELGADEASLRATVAQVLDKEWQRHLEEQATWPAVTDFDRLEEAFRLLRQKGIVARHDFTCCGNCGSAEIYDELDEERERGMMVNGYAFYHQQDTESAVSGSGLYFNYGPSLAGELSFEEVARHLVDALEKVGLSVRWNGNTNSRVFALLDWKRRLPVV